MKSKQRLACLIAIGALPLPLTAKAYYWDVSGVTPGASNADGAPGGTWSYSGGNFTRSTSP